MNRALRAYRPQRGVHSGNSSRRGPFPSKAFELRHRRWLARGRSYETHGFQARGLREPVPRATRKDTSSCGGVTKLTRGVSSASLPDRFQAQSYGGRDELRCTSCGENLRLGRDVQRRLRNSAR